MLHTLLFSIQSRTKAVPIAAAAAASTTQIRRELATRTRTNTSVCTRGVDFHVKIRNPDASHMILCMPGALGTARTDFGPLLDDGLNISKDDDAQIVKEEEEEECFGIVALDPRGLGQSKILNQKIQQRTYPLDFYHRDALDAHSVMHALGFENFSVLGWSDGGITALHLASHKHTKKSVRRLVVWGANAYITQKDLDAWEAVRDVRISWSERMRKERAAVMPNGTVEELQRCNHQLTDAYRDIFFKRNGDLCLQQLKHIESPTLVIHGDKDIICHMHHAEYIARHIKGSSLKILSGAKHNLHLRHASQFNEIVSDFLKD